MNLWILSAGILGLFTSLVHILAGQVDPVRPLLQSDLPDIPKATLLACWHMVSVVLVLTSSALAYAGWLNITSLYASVMAISIIFVFFAFVFIAAGWSFFGFRTFIKLPQWVLLLPIGLLGLMGTL